MIPKEHPILTKLNLSQECLPLLEDLAKRWLAHDGLWFQAIEKEYGIGCGD